MWGVVAVGIVMATSRASAALLQPTNPDGSCALGWFHCGGNSSQCVEQRYLCNHIHDCPGGGDETDCFDDKADNLNVKQILNTTVLPWHLRHHCSLDAYPEACTCRIYTTLHCPSLNLSAVPPHIDPAVTALLLSDNVLQLKPGTFEGYPYLTRIHLEGNGLQHLPDGVFRGLTSLRRLFLQNNSLTEVRPGALEDLTSLYDLDLSANQVTDFDHLLTHLPALATLWMNENRVTLLAREVSPNAHQLMELSLEHNLVTILGPRSLQGLSGLTSLYLRHNQIELIEEGAFLELTNLVDLELNHNRLQHLEPYMLKGLQSLASLNLDGNQIHTIAANTFTVMMSLASMRVAEMDLSEELLYNVSTGLQRQPAPNLTHVYMARFRYCGHLPAVKDCHPKTDGVSSFEHLLVRVELRVAVWLVAFLTLLGNLTVLGGRGMARDDNKLLSLFIKNLAVADLLTGIYLLVVASKDVEFRSEYREHAYYWMTSWHCTLVGVLAMTSSEVSVLVLVIMSVERWVCITWPLSSPRLSLPAARTLLAAVWGVGILLALAPVAYYRSQQGFYGTNGLCFPLHLDDPWVPGWLYSAVVFVGINQLGVFAILGAYLGMFISIRVTRGSTPLNQGDREFALRFFFIVFTDVLCWTPIIILRIMALAEVDIKPELYAYVVVVLLPINSAINPWLYTFTTVKFRTQARRFLQRRCCCSHTKPDPDSEATRISVLRNGRDFVPLHRRSSPDDPSQELHLVSTNLRQASTTTI